MSYIFYLFTRYLLMLFIYLFFYFFDLSEWSFVLCGLIGTKTLNCFWSPFWFCSVKMAIKTYDFLRDPKFTTYGYVPCSSQISGADLNHFFIPIQQFKLACDVLYKWHVHTTCIFINLMVNLCYDLLLRYIVNSLAIC